MANPYHRFAYINTLKAFGAISIVFLHVASISLLLVKYDSVDATVLTEILGVCRIAVPAFFAIPMISYLSRDYIPFGTFLKTRNLKVLGMFLFWSLFYLIFSEKPLNAWSHAIRYGTAYYHLWFLFVLFALYLIIPILYRFINNLTQKQFLILILTWFTFFILPNKPWVDMELFVINTHVGQYLGYALCGYYLHKYPLPQKAIAPLFFLGLFILYFNNKYEMNKIQHLTEAGTLPDTVGVAVLFVAIFSFLYHFKAFPNAIKYIAQNSMTIYFMHPFFLTIIDVYAPTVHNSFIPKMNIYIAGLIACVYAIVLCLLTSFVYKRVKKTIWNNIKNITIKWPIQKLYHSEK